METRFQIDKDKLEVTSETIFDAPAEEIYKAYTDPMLIPEWWGPSRFTTTVDKMDVVSGGVWRYVQCDADGKEYAFNGKYEEIVPNKKLVSTFEFEDMPGHVSTDILTLEEIDGKTKMSVKTKFSSLEDLEGMTSTGMEEGWSESMERLEKLLEKNNKHKH